jgi:hypothetical protein
MNFILQYEQSLMTPVTEPKLSTLAGKKAMKL